MDNLCHTLVGAALAQSGLKRRTRLATATLVIGANLPDLDVLSILTGQALAFRRGWTHGILAIAVLPFVLTGLMILWGRWQAHRTTGLTPLVPRQLLWLGTIAVITHPFLDWLNVYGVRLLSPFSNRWFYGDAVFIVDPWLWIVLGSGAIWSALRHRRGVARAGAPATVGLILAGIYIAGMIGLTQYGRQVLTRVLELDQPPSKGAVQIAPNSLNPVRRHVVLASGDKYWFGTIEWRPTPRLVLPGDNVKRNLEEPHAAALKDDPRARQLLAWARFPYYMIEGVANRSPGSADRQIRLDDARYSTGRASWAAAVAAIK